MSFLGARNSIALGIQGLISAGTNIGATVPGAPTIGTATATGATTATVSFTQPASNGGSVITSYTATSSPSGITGVLNQAGSGTITVTGLASFTSYTFTVTATNAIGTSAPSAASNSITTTDAYWANVSMLLHGDGVNGGQNNTFLDGSVNNFTVTRNGNATQGSFNPFTPVYPYAVATNGGSGYFDGTGDYLSLAANAVFTIPVSTSFTIEAWIYITDLAYVNGNIICANQQASSGYIFLYNPTIGLRFYAGSGVVDINQGSVAGWTANTWYHVAVVRDGASAITLYRNGVSVATGISVLSFGTGPLYVGGSPGDSAFMNGYISNFRLANGFAVYTAAFTPPTAPLTTVTNTQLLLGMSNAAIFDNAELNNLETVGTGQISTSTFKYGTGSLYFSGTRPSKITSPASSSLALGSGDFTLEMWCYEVSKASGYPRLINFNADYAVNTSALMMNPNDAPNKFRYAVPVNMGDAILVSTSTLSSSVWYHVAVTRSGSTFRLFVNGVQEATYSNAGTIDSGSTAYIALGDTPTATASEEFNGYIDDLRITKGVARYTANFTPPTAAFPNS
jgi:hypothetical protein